MDKLRNTRQGDRGFEERSGVLDSNWVDKLLGCRVGNPLSRRNFRGLRVPPFVIRWLGTKVGTQSLNSLCADICMRADFAIEFTLGQSRIGIEGRTLSSRRQRSPFSSMAASGTDAQNTMRHQKPIPIIGFQRLNVIERETPKLSNGSKKKVGW